MPQYEEVKLSRLYEQIVKQIERKILDGELQIGDQLPPERELAEQFKVSRTAVREAVKALREKGLVEAYPGRGTFVTNGTSHAVRQSLGLMLSIDQAGGLANLVEVREILEPEIAYLAALRVESEQIDSMQAAIAAMDTSLADGDAFIRGDLDFHLALAKATHNGLVLTLINPIVELLQEHRKSIFHIEGGPERGQHHHKRILDAVALHDPDAAREAMRAHLRQVREDSKTFLVSGESDGTLLE